MPRISSRRCTTAQSDDLSLSFQKSADLFLISSALVKNASGDVVTDSRIVSRRIHQSGRSALNGGAVSKLLMPLGSTALMRFPPTLRRYRQPLEMLAVLQRQRIVRHARFRNEILEHHARRCAGETRALA